MKKRLAACTCAAALLLSGCGALSNEYSSEKPYLFSTQESVSTDGKVAVDSFAQLKQELLRLAYDGETNGKIIFDAGYEGDIVADVASACWQVRTQDALCAYCVENIAYEINKIVTISEANVYISYSDVNEHPSNIHTRSYVSGITPLVKEALEKGSKRLVMLISRSSYDDIDMIDAVKAVYRRNPAITPTEPAVSVAVFSGTGAQRLYEITIGYGMQDEEREDRVRAMAELQPFEAIETEEMDDAARAELACRWLMDNCELSAEASDGNAYSALIKHSANSTGMALAMVELCHRLNIDCRIVYGQRDWEEHSWNIVKIGDSYYHVDVSACITDGFETAFLRNDEAFWNLYRWDVSAYPKCSTLYLRPVETSEPVQDEEAISENAEAAEA